MFNPLKQKDMSTETKTAQQTKPAAVHTEGPVTERTRTGQKGAWQRFRIPQITLPNGRVVPEHTVLTTAAKLLYIGKENNQLVNTNGKKYIINHVQMKGFTGDTIETGAMCYEGNYNPALRNDPVNTDPLEVGMSYLLTMRQDEMGRPQLQMSHLPSVNRISAAQLAAEFAFAGWDLPADAIQELNNEPTGDANAAQKAGGQPE